MIKSYTLFETPLTPDYKKVIDNIQSVNSQLAFNTAYMTYLVTNYAYDSETLSSTKNVIFDENSLTLLVNGKLRDTREYNYVALEDESGNLTFYFIVGYYSQNVNITQLKLKRDAWANNYYDIYSNSSYKNKIVRSHLDEGYFNTIEERCEIEYDTSYKTNENVNRIYSDDLNSYVNIDNRYKVLFAKIYMVDVIYSNNDKDKPCAIPLEEIDSMPIYYAPVALVDMKEQNVLPFTIQRFNSILGIDENYHDIWYKLDGTIIINDSTYDTPSYYNTKTFTLGVNGFSMRYLYGLTMLIESTLTHIGTIAKVELTYNFPLKYYVQIGVTNNIYIPACVITNIIFNGEETSIDDFALPILCSCFRKKYIYHNRYEYNYSNNNIEQLLYKSSDYTDKTTFAKFLKTDDIFNNFPYNYLAFNNGSDLEPFIKDTHAFKTYNNMLIIKSSIYDRLYKIYKAYDVSHYDEVNYKWDYITSVGRPPTSVNVVTRYLQENSGSIILGALGTIGSTIERQSYSPSFNYATSTASNVLRAYKQGSKQQTSGNDYADDLFLQDNLSVIEHKCRMNDDIWQKLYDWYYKGHIYTKYENVNKRIRKYFDYKQTSDCQLPFIKNINDRMDLETAFNNGLTIVHAINSDTNISNLTLYQLINEVV